MSYFLVMAKSCKKTGRIMVKMGTSGCLTPSELNWKLVRNGGTIPVLRLILTFSTMAWTNFIFSSMCSTHRIFGAIKTIPFPSSSSQAWMVWMTLNPRRSNHFIWDSSLVYWGSASILKTFDGSHFYCPWIGRLWPNKAWIVSKEGEQDENERREKGKREMSMHGGREWAMSSFWFPC